LKLSRGPIAGLFCGAACLSPKEGFRRQDAPALGEEFDAILARHMPIEQNEVKRLASGVGLDQPLVRLGRACDRRDAVGTKWMEKYYLDGVKYGKDEYDAKIPLNTSGVTPQPRRQNGGVVSPR
jgi:hypothetical protein